MAEAAADNQPPVVSILWPEQRDEFSSVLKIKIKAKADDPDGSVAEVKFFADTTLIGVATNPPFNLVWPVDPPGGYDRLFILRAVAVDNQGANAESAPVVLAASGTAPPAPVVQMTAPRDEALFAAPATFTFSAEVLASSGGAGPVEFFVGTNSVGLVDRGVELTANTLPSSVVVSNLSQGKYELTVRFRGGDGKNCSCNWITNAIRVVQLGVQLPSVTADGRLQFEVVTSFPGKPTIIQASPNLMDWVPISTNQPSSNSFTFTDTAPATDSQRFYRVFVPP